MVAPGTTTRLLTRIPARVDCRHCRQSVSKVDRVESVLRARCGRWGCMKSSFWYAGEILRIDGVPHQVGHEIFAQARQWQSRR